MVGQRFISLLENHPWFEVTTIAASPRSAGKTYEEAVGDRWKMDTPMPEAVKKIVVMNVNEVEKVAAEVDFVFSAVDMTKEEIKKIEEEYAKTETPVVSNNSAHRWTPDVPMVVPEVNPEHMEVIKYQKERLGTKRGFVAVKPNCSIQSYAPVLTAWKEFEPYEVVATTYQAISASVNTADAASFAGTATKLAVGGFTSATTAVDVLTTAINAYGLAASDATQLSDYLITTQNLGKTSVDQLAQSVGKVIPLASAYNVQMDNLSSAYAVLTANGIATAESGTYLKSMLNELGDTGSDVSEVLLNSTGKTFAQLMEQGYSLGDVMAMLGNAVDGDSTAFNALWSSTEAGIGALSLFNAGADKYNSVLDSMRTSAGATEKAYSTMADTTDKSKQRMENSFNNLKISVGDVLNPALTQVYEGFTSVFAGMSDFVDEHPAVVAAISAIAVGVGGFTGALAAYNIATTAAKFVTEAFTATLAANPFVLAAAGIVAVTAAAVTLTGVSRRPKRS